MIHKWIVGASWVKVTSWKLVPLQKVKWPWMTNIFSVNHLERGHMDLNIFSPYFILPVFNSKRV